MSLIDRILTRIGKILFGPDDYPAIDRLRQVVNHRSDHDVLGNYLDQTTPEVSHFNSHRDLINQRSLRFIDGGPLSDENIAYVRWKERGVTSPAKQPSYETSVRPAAPVSKKKALLTFIKAHSPKGITAEQVGRAFPAWRYSTVSARISELYKAGTIVAVGTAQTDTGALAKLYAVAQEG